MAGPKRFVAVCLMLGLLACAVDSALAQPQPATEPIGGITFDPPRPAAIRHTAGNLIKGHVIAISPEFVQIRLRNGRAFQYELKNIRSIVTTDRKFRYIAAVDTYREAVERARRLAGVSIEEVTIDGGRRDAPELPSPPAPPPPTVVDSPDNYQPHRIDPEALASSDQAAGGAEAPQPAGQRPHALHDQPAAANTNVVGPPIHETGGFKIGFLIVCLVVILLWWRNRVG